MVWCARALLCLPCGGPASLAMFEDQATVETQPETTEKVFPIYGYSKIKKSSSNSKASTEGRKCWRIKVTNEGLPLDQGILDILEWQEDDVIEWKVTEEGFLSFTRVQK